MLLELTLTNFKQHRDLNLTFTEGLNVLRASNEAGKSTIFEAVAYALWGSRALPESFEETVTWGESQSSLKVRLKFLYSGAEYLIVRGKSGAELVGPGVTASGQAEVTAFIERLFGASSQVGFATLVANQGALQEGLDGTSISLIEKLSNMGVIDELIEKVQAGLPCGNTKGIEQNLLRFEDLVEPVPDFASKIAGESAAQAALGLAETEASNAKDALATHTPLALAAAARIRRQAEDEAAKTAAERQLADLRFTEPVAPVVQRTVAVLEQAKEAQAEATIVYQAWNKFQNLTAAGSSGGTLADLLAQITQLETDIPKHRTEIEKRKIEQATVKASIITQSACGLCGKDLQNVPEVVSANETAQARVAALTAMITEDSSVLLQAADQLKRYRVLRDNNALRLSEVKGLSPYVTVDTNALPCTVTWSGPQAFKPSTENFALLIKSARESESTYRQAVAKYEASVQLKKNLEHKVLHTPVAMAKAEDADTVKSQALCLQMLQNANAKLQQAKFNVSSAVRELENAKAAFELQKAAYAEALASKQALLDLLTATNFHNGIVRKLRDARPVVARELWNMVLTGVSQVFSHIRGVPSIVTRGNSKFLIDGKPFSSYSGSTKDSLGLANRIMLQKTFLGGLDFLMLDEPASGADAEREDNMLAAITRADYRQVILVTHSERADTFATNVLTL